MPKEIVDFNEEVSTVVNFGKYASQVMVDGTSNPTWTGREGEQVIAYVTSAGVGYTLYHWYWINSSWCYTVFIGNQSI